MQNACWVLEPKPRKSVATPPVERLQGSISGPCRGIGDSPQQADFPGFRGGEKRENRFVCTTKHCLPLLRTAIEEVRLIPIRRTIPNAHSRIICIL